LVGLGFPTLIGTSRKSTIGKLTGRDVDARELGTAATVALAIAAGIDVVRVHDVAGQRDAVRVADAVIRGWRPDGWTEKLP
jgi:dihydropteroate synthase